MASLEEFRKAKDEFFLSNPQSPLTPEQRRSFHGLSYFPENTDLRVGAKLEPDQEPEGTKITMDTTTGTERPYRRVGSVRFEVDGQQAELALYSSEEDESLFVPFRDATSGKETYGGGRYLETDPPEDGNVVLDFNYAYNPYCVYSEHWSCPIPPRENWLPVPIRAGETNFEGS
jgi:uncharacterized protein